MSAVAVIAEGRARTDDEIREAMSGNLCRCGAYPKHRRGGRRRAGRRLMRAFDFVVADSAAAARTLCAKFRGRASTPAGPRWSI